MRTLTVYEDGYVPQDPILGGGTSSVVSGGTLISDAPRGTSQVSTAIPENPNVSEPRPRETYEPLGSDPKPPKGAGASVVAEPDLGTSPTNPKGNINVLPLPILGGGGGGAMGGGSGSSSDEPKDKKPFPYWVLIAGLVGGYLVFRK